MPTLTQPSTLQSLSLPMSTQLSSLDQEVSLVLSCATTNLERSDIERIQTLLQGAIDWQRLIQIAAYHGVLPLLHQSLTNQAIDQNAIPQTTRQHLQNYCRINGIRSLGFTQELLRLLKVFKAHGIDVIPYKGPVLSVMAYGNVVLRQYRDLDFLIHPEDFSKIEEILVSENYYNRDPDMSRAQRSIYFQSSCEYTFMNQDNTVALEPHWDILPRRFCISLKPQDLWQHQVSVSLLGTPTSTFSPEEMLLVVCLNGAKDRWKKLKLICDVAQLLHMYPTMDWDRLLERTSILGCRRILFLGLFLANRLLGVALPVSVRHLIVADSVIPTLAEKVCMGLSQAKPANKKGLKSNFSIWDLMLKERLYHRVMYCINLFFKINEGDAALLSLPRPLHFIYYLIRPFRLIKLYSTQVLKKIIHLLTAVSAERKFPSA